MAMRFSLLAAAAIFAGLALPAAVPAASPAAKSAPAKADWTRAIVDTGVGWRMGNPKAPKTLVEYGSFNCPHCAAFEKAAMPAIRKLVAAGKISFEFRPKQLFPHDPSATLLAHCVGKGRAFAFTEDYMAHSAEVLTRLRAAYKADKGIFDKAQAAGPAANARMMARVGGMGAIAARHGVDAARANQCLGDAKLLARVSDNEAAALGAGVKGTPTFFIDGEPATIEDVRALGIPVTL